MPNICLDTVVFYATSDDQKKGLAAFRQAVLSCYNAENADAVNVFMLRRIFEQNGIPADDIYLRSDVENFLFKDGCVTLCCHSAWHPPYEGYARLANHFGVSFVLQAEEPGFSIYINTDTDNVYFSVGYKVFLVDRPEDGSLDELFGRAEGETDFYFNSDKDVLEWFMERGSIAAATLEELKARLDKQYVCIHEFVNPYL